MMSPLKYARMKFALEECRHHLDAEVVLMEVGICQSLVGLIDRALGPNQDEPDDAVQHEDLAGLLDRIHSVTKGNQDYE